MESSSKDKVKLKKLNYLSSKRKESKALKGGHF
jgi:hypothetical protein